MRKYWFFDLDGTLADTDGDIRESWKAAMADLGLVCPDFDRKFVAGPSIEEMTKSLFPDIYSEALAQNIREGFGRHYDNDGFKNTLEYPGILDEVRNLKSLGAKVYIATNKRYSGAVKMAEHFLWDNIFDGIYTSDMHKDDEIGKLRKPELLKLILSETGAKSDECVMVGDTINDFEAARVNSIFSVGVSWGYAREGELSQADLVIDRAEDLRKIYDL
jgi:phosphoglycolate phosphatase